MAGNSDLTIPQGKHVFLFLCPVCLDWSVFVYELWIPIEWLIMGLEQLVSWCEFYNLNSYRMGLSKDLTPTLPLITESMLLHIKLI